MIRCINKIVSVVFIATASLAVSAQSADEDFERGSYSAGGEELPYRLHRPANQADATAIPLIVYLHGSGGWGSENNRQIAGGNVHGTRLWLNSEIAAQHPAFVLAPQLPRPQRWSDPDSEDLSTHAQLLLELIDKLKAELAIDENRIYLMGQSLGGMGVWDIVAKRPEIFAAGVPVCGEGNTQRIANAHDVPLWAFHGAIDTTVDVEGSREMVASLEAAGGDIRYTEYPDVGHNSWERAFADPRLPAWLFAQSKDRDGK